MRGEYTEWSAKSEVQRESEKRQVQKASAERQVQTDNPHRDLNTLGGYDHVRIYPSAYGKIPHVVAENDC